MKERKRGEFRKHRDSENHMHYVFGRKGNHFKSIGLTTKSHTKATKNTPESDNVQLSHNPRIGDNTTAYARPFYIQRHKDRYKEPLAGWEFHPKDVPKIERIKKRGEPLNGGMERHKVNSITGHTRHTTSNISQKNQKSTKNKK